MFFVKALSQYPYKLSWNFSKKSKYDDILLSWKMTFQALNLKGYQFLDLCDDDNNPLEPSYAKGGTWLKYFGHSNSLCARAIRAITNHTSTGEYRLKFFPQEGFSYLCGNYSIKTRWHILHKCKRYNKYWNPRRDMISHFILFLKFNCYIVIIEYYFI